MSIPIFHIIADFLFQFEAAALVISLCGLPEVFSCLFLLPGGPVDIPLVGQIRHIQV